MRTNIKEVFKMNIEQFNNDIYKEYKSLDENKFYIFKVFRELKTFTKTNSISLDVGCADGSFSKMLRDELGFTTYGIDISKDVVELAKKNNVIAIQHDLNKNLPYKNNSFDVIIACEIIEHIFDTDKLISEFNRVLKKDGIIIISTPNLASLTNRIRLLFGLYPEYVPQYNATSPLHIRAYTIPILKKQLESHGFKIINITSPNIPFPMIRNNIPFWIKNIAYKLGDYLPSFSSHIIMTLSKS